MAGTVELKTKICIIKNRVVVGGLVITGYCGEAVTVVMVVVIVIVVVAVVVVVVVKIVVAGAVVE